MPIDAQIFEHYKQNIEIDYFTYFIKCYLALNAYIKIKFAGNDREKIDKLKEDITIQTRFKELLNNDIFCSNLKELKQNLYESQIENENNIISFEKVKIQSFQEKPILEDNQPIKKNGITYNLKICAGKEEKISFECLNEKQEEIAKDECKYCELETKLNKTKLSKYQRDTIKSCFDEEIKKYNENLMDTIEGIKETKGENYGLIYKGFIEIIYQLRNALFHSQIDSAKESVRKTYKIAYLLFKDFIEKLPTEDIK